MTFRKHGGHRARQQIDGSGNVPTTSPEQPQQMQTTPDKRSKKPKKMSGLRKAIRAVFLPKQAGSGKDISKDIPSPANLSVKDGCQTTESGSKDQHKEPQQPARKESPSDQTLQTEQQQERVASDKERSPGQSAASEQCLQEPRGPSPQQPAATGKDNQEIDTEKEALTSPPSNDAPASPAPPTPKIVYHPHLGCRMYDRDDIQPAVVDRYGRAQGMVGEGAFAQVTVVRLPDDTLAAAKVLQAPEPEGPLWQEIIAVAAVGEHPSFAKLYGVVKQKPLRTMLYEFVGDRDTLRVTTLQDALDWKGTPAALSRKTWLRIVHNICEGLLHLHNNEYVHCDIKADNILLHQVGEGKKTRWHAKIIDLGNACLEVAGPWLRIPEHLIDRMYTECPHMAPEVLEGDSPFNKPAEVYALGDLLSDIGKAAGIRRLRRLSERCQDADFTKRPTMAQICQEMAKHWK